MSRKDNWLRPLSLGLILAGAFTCLSLAAHSTTGQELISLLYLKETVLPELLQAGETTLQAQEEALLAQGTTQLEAQNSLYTFQLGALDGTLSRSDGLTDQRFKREDRLSLSAGCEVLLLAGEASYTPTTGTLIDLTLGTAVERDTALLPNHRYLAAERSIADITVSSDTAVLCLNGAYLLTPSDCMDYIMLADALKELGLFKGSDTGYGSGYDLEAEPTRIQGLILFLRLIGEEAAALETTAACPFTDVPAWAQPYVAYAYEQGYTKGMSETTFSPSMSLRSSEYLTFLLRALGYQDSGETPDFTWDTALNKALEWGILNAQEHKLLTEQPFLRAQVVYTSYYALDAKLKDSDVTLLTALTASGALDEETVQAVRQAVTVARLPG